MFTLELNKEKDTNWWKPCFLFGVIFLSYWSSCWDKSIWQKQCKEGCVWLIPWDCRPQRKGIWRTWSHCQLSDQAAGSGRWSAQILHFIQLLSSACEIVILTVKVSFLTTTNFLSVIPHSHYHELVCWVTADFFKLRINIKHYSGQVLLEKEKN